MEITIKKDGKEVWSIDTSNSSIEVYIDGTLYLKHSKELEPDMAGDYI